MEEYEKIIKDLEFLSESYGVLISNAEVNGSPLEQRYVDLKSACDKAVEIIKGIKEEYSGGKLLKKRYGEYVTYKVDYLLNNLTREVYIMESARRIDNEGAKRRPRLC